MGNAINPVFSVEEASFVLTYGSYCSKGVNDDVAHDVVRGFLRLESKTTKTPTNTKSASIIGLYSGHGSVECAEFLSEKIPYLIVDNTFFPVDIKQAILNSFSEIESRYVQFALEKNCTSSFLICVVWQNILYVATFGSCVGYICKGKEAILLSSPQPKIPEFTTQTNHIIPNIVQIDITPETQFCILGNEAFWVHWKSVRDAIEQVSFKLSLKYPETSRDEIVYKICMELVKAASQGNSNNNNLTTISCVLIEFSHNRSIFSRSSISGNNSAQSLILSQSTSPSQVSLVQPSQPLPDQNLHSLPVQQTQMSHHKDVAPFSEYYITENNPIYTKPGSNNQFNNTNDKNNFGENFSNTKIALTTTTTTTTTTVTTTTSTQKNYDADEEALSVFGFARSRTGDQHDQQYQKQHNTQPKLENQLHFFKQLFTKPRTNTPPQQINEDPRDF